MLINSGLKAGDLATANFSHLLRRNRSHATAPARPDVGSHGGDIFIWQPGQRWHVGESWIRPIQIAPVQDAAHQIRDGPSNDLGPLERGSDGGLTFTLGTVARCADGVLSAPSLHHRSCQLAI